MTRKRRHHNNKGYRKIKNGRTHEEVKRMAEKLFKHREKMKKFKECNEGDK